MEVERTTHSPEETRAWAAELANLLSPGSVLALHGDLGAGKTCFIQGLASGLDVRETVASPTYTLVHEYTGRLPLYHIDLYRIHDSEEALDIGLDEYISGNGVTAIEWADRAGDVLSADTWHIWIAHGATPDERVITLKGQEA